MKVSNSNGVNSNMETKILNSARLVSNSNGVNSNGSSISNKPVISGFQTPTE